MITCGLVVVWFGMTSRVCVCVPLALVCLLSSWILFGNQDLGVFLTSFHLNALVTFPVGCAVPLQSVQRAEINRVTLAAQAWAFIHVVVGKKEMVVHVGSMLDGLKLNVPFELGDLVEYFSDILKLKGKVFLKFMRSFMRKSWMFRMVESRELTQTGMMLLIPLNTWD